jgi:signal peptidase II
LDTSDLNKDIPLENEAKQSFSPYLVPFFVIFLVLALDQIFKIWVKTNMELHSEIPVIGNWFILHFIENEGMAFGLKIWGKYGKLLLTVFRVIAVGFGFYLLYTQLKSKAHQGFIICIALILGGALGNIIDSVFYGVWFQNINYYQGGLLHGRVVDMLYFPIIEGTYPEWFPFKGGQEFIFFSPVFNIADAAISGGVISILVFQKKFFSKSDQSESTDIEKTASIEEMEASFTIQSGGEKTESEKDKKE